MAKTGEYPQFDTVCPPLWKSWLRLCSKWISIGGRIENAQGTVSYPRLLSYKQPDEINILTTRSSAGMGTFSFCLNLSLTCFSPINRTRQSTPVITAPMFAEGMFFIIYVKIWKQLSPSLVWIIEKVKSNTKSWSLWIYVVKSILEKNPILKFSGAREATK